MLRRRSAANLRMALLRKQDFRPHFGGRNANQFTFTRAAGAIIVSARVPTSPGNLNRRGLGMPQISKLIDRFCIWAIWLALKLQNILIGPLPENGKGGRGRIAQFIQFVLHYSPLLGRLAFAAAASCLLWLLGWPLAAKLAFLACEIYASLLVIRFLAGAPRLGQFGRIVAAMWLPIAVIAVAIYLLFVNDQGRELGVGLMDPNKKGIFLGLALIYWALNNWLSARVGLDRSFRKPEKEQELLFWGPRLVGVGAHLLAAISLSFAAWNQPDMQDGIVDTNETSNRLPGNGCTLWESPSFSSYQALLQRGGLTCSRVSHRQRCISPSPPCSF